MKKCELIGTKYLNQKIIVKSTKSGLTSVAIMVLNFCFVMAVNAIPNNRLYYAIYKNDGDQLNRLFPFSLFADPFPSSSFYENRRQDFNIAKGEPNQKLSFKNIIEGDETNPPQESNIIQNKRHFDIEKSDELLIGKKYDRNCFFSPVQCMLSFNKKTNNEELWSGRGRRK